MSTGTCDWVLDFLSQVRSSGMTDLCFGLVDFYGCTWNPTSELKALENVLLGPQFRNLTRVGYVDFTGNDTVRASMPARLPRLAERGLLQDLDLGQYEAEYCSMAQCL